MNKKLNQLIHYNDRILKLIDSIKNYNNQSEYFRLKYYSNMIFDLKLLNQYMNKEL